MTTIPAPAAVTLPEPSDPAYIAQLTADRDAHVANWEHQAFALLAGQIKAEIARQPRVRVRVGGYAGDLGRISGVGAAGGHVVTTDSGWTLVLAEKDIVRLDTKGE